jgi:large subunit ribosomal protein L2
MALRQLKPVTAGTRGVILVDRKELHKGDPVKFLTEGIHSSGGRNNHGHITSRHRGAGHKQRYRIIDFKRRKGGTASVERLEYDPNRSAFIALLKYQDGTLSYILAPQRIQAGDTVEAGEKADIKPGNALPLSNIPVGTIVHNIEMKMGAGGQIARSAGTYAQIIGRDQGMAQLRLSSGEMRVVRADCWATIGAVSNADHQNRQIGKAGRNRWRGIRPQTRGEAMNPVDHPHGGRTRGGRHPQTPWGKPTKGYKTRHNKQTDKFIIRRRKAK